MFRMSATACIDAPADKLWAHLSRLDQIHLWTDVIHDSHMAEGATCGVGATRACEIQGARRLHERVIAWDEGRSFTYESHDAPLMRWARNRWSVTPVGERTLVTSEAELELRGGWLGRLAGYVLVPLMRRLLPNPIAKFKFWVETGRPYEGRARALPVPAAGC